MAISSATVTAYYDNNFDINNIPANPTVLAAASSTVNVGVINCLPFSGKSRASITIKAFDKLKETSYFKISFNQDSFDWYATVEGYEYTSMDIVRVDLIIDAWLTCGGTTGITSVSGLTKRHSCSDDTFGRYTLPDGLIAPSETLKMSDIEEIFTGSGYTSDGGYIIVESTVNLWKMGMNGATYEAITYEDLDNAESVTVPQVEPITSADEATIEMHDIFNVGNYQIDSPCVAYFNGADDTVKKGIAICRSLGVESAILAQYVIPSGFISNITYDSTETGRITSITAKGEIVGNLATGDIEYEYATVNNQRVLYGENNRYVLLCVGTGNKIESSPEEIYYSGETTPAVYVMSDPRSNGTPYYRFVHMYGSSNNFAVNAVQGNEWQNAPIKYDEKAGAGVATTIFNTTREIKNADYELGKVQNYVSEAAGGLTGMLSAGVSAIVDENLNDKIFAAKRAFETAKFKIENTVVAPELNFPRSEGLRDIVGNGICVFRYRYTDNDVARIDKILNMYGYVDVKPLELTDFTAMKYYSYIEADCTIVTSVKVSKAIREMCQQQISAGVRVWKQNPDYSLYSQSNREV